MKALKLTFQAITALLLTVLFTGCHKEYITEKHYDGAQISTLEYTVKPGDWNYDGDYFGTRPYAYFECDNQDINDRVMKEGAVLGYMWNVYDKDGNASWNTLPYVYSYNTTDNDGNNITVAENIRFEYENGKVTFVVEDLDGNMAEALTDNYLFKIVVLQDR